MSSHVHQSKTRAKHFGSVWAIFCSTTFVSFSAYFLQVGMDIGSYCMCSRATEFSQSEKGWSPCTINETHPCTSIVLHFQNRFGRIGESLFDALSTYIASALNVRYSDACYVETWVTKLEYPVLQTVRAVPHLQRHTWFDPASPVRNAPRTRFPVILVGAIGM